MEILPPNLKYTIWVVLVALVFRYAITEITPHPTNIIEIIFFRNCLLTAVDSGQQGKGEHEFHHSGVVIRTDGNARLL